MGSLRLRVLGAGVLLLLRGMRFFLVGILRRFKHAFESGHGPLREKSCGGLLRLHSAANICDPFPSRHHLQHEQGKRASSVGEYCSKVPLLIVETGTEVQGEAPRREAAVASRGPGMVFGVSPG